MKIRALVLTIVITSLLVFLGPLLLYLKYFGNGFSSINGDWGDFGGYFGGVVSPTFSFIGFLALLYTIFLQRSEIQLTKSELEDNRLSVARENIRKDLLISLEKIETRLEAKRGYYSTFIGNLSKNNISSYPDFREIVSLLSMLNDKLVNLKQFNLDANLVEYYCLRFDEMASALNQLGYIHFKTIAEEK